MEYGTSICSETCDDNYQRFVGFQENNECIRAYFSPNTVNAISKKITQLLMGIHPKNLPIIVPNRTICSVMSSIYSNFKPATGDIYSRYNIPNNEQQNNVQNMIDQVIEIITSQIRNEYGIIEANSKLTIWTTVLGDFNSHGLRQHAPIKVRNKRPNPMSFNMNY